MRDLEGPDCPGIDYQWRRYFPCPSRPTTRLNKPPVQCREKTAKRPGRGAGHPPPSRAEAANWVEIYIRIASVRAQAYHGRPLHVYTEVSTYVRENRLRLRYKDESSSTVKVKIGVVISNMKHIDVWTKYRVIRKSFRNFWNRMLNNQYRHSRKELLSTCMVGQKLAVSLPLLTCCPSVWPSRLLYRRGRTSRRDWWITLYRAPSGYNRCITYLLLGFKLLICKLYNVVGTVHVYQFIVSTLVQHYAHTCTVKLYSDMYSIH
jgi:hypothetical protein